MYLSDVDFCDKLIRYIIAKSCMCEYVMSNGGSYIIAKSCMCECVMSNGRSYIIAKSCMCECVMSNGGSYLGRGVMVMSLIMWY